MGRRRAARRHRNEIAGQDVGSAMLPAGGLISGACRTGAARSGGVVQLIAIRRAMASLALGRVSVSTPSSSWALMPSRSTLLDRVKPRP
jgi:hypothetical protein